MNNERFNPFGSILEYLRRSATPFFLNLMFGMTLFAIAAITNTEMRVILTVLIAVLTYFTDFMLIRSMGELAYKMKTAGERRRAGQPSGMSEKGVEGYKYAKEYRPYKGFVIGAVVSLVPIVFIIGDVCTQSAGARLVYGMIAGWAFFPVFNLHTEADILFSLIPCAVMIIVSGIAYIVGSGREKLRQFALEQREAEIEKAKGARKR